MRILFLSRWLPYPPDNGSKIRIFNLIRQLAKRHEVSLLAFGDPAELADASAIHTLREHCAGVRVLPRRPYHPAGAKALAGLFSMRPRSLVDTYSKAMGAATMDEFRTHGCDLVVASQWDMVPYILGLRGAPALLEELELSTFVDAATRSPSPAHRMRSRLTWLKMRAYLRRVLPRFDACTVASEVERTHVRRAVPGYSNVEVIPNAVDLARYDGQFGPADPNSLIFSGALTYHANFDAVRHFLGSIYPAIRRAVPDCTFRVTGRTAGVDLAALPPSPGVAYTGYLDDVRPVVAQSWVTVVPLRLGGGTRLKILESMALGTPVVATAKGAEGLDVTDGENILIADEPEAFAMRVVELLRSPELRSRLAAGGRRLVESKYDWQAAGEKLSSLVEALVPGQERRVGGPLPVWWRPAR